MLESVKLHVFALEILTNCLDFLARTVDLHRLICHGDRDFYDFAHDFDCRDDKGL